MRKIYIRLIFTILNLLLFVTLNAQIKTTYKYFIGNSEPSAEWKNKEFDVSSWNSGFGSIGFGDKDDSIIIAQTSSVYLRYYLSLTPAYMQNKLPIVFNLDFDDGFIGYINGVEFLRVNMPETPANPDHLTLTNRSHEAEGYREKLGRRLPAAIGVYRPVKGYYIDTVILSKCNLDTINVLAFQVHNDSLNGSDMTFNCNAQIIPNNFNYNLYSNRFSAPVKLDTSRLPLIIIETNEYGVNDTDAIAFMGVINNGKGNLNSITDPFTDYKGRIRIKLHGQTSKDYPKKQFKIELQDSSGKDLDTSLMGMPQGTDWILYGPFPDKSLLRNQVIFKIGKKMGHYEPRTRFCELLYNGKNMGLYALTEQIRRDNKRVNITEMEPADNSGEAVTGGYIFRYDKDLQGTPEIIYPNNNNITPAQRTYLLNYITETNNAFLGNNFRDTSVGYRKYVNAESLADYIIVNEMTKNVDAYYYSTYMYKDRGGKINYGPLWDYDFSMGYTLWADLSTTDWQFQTRSFLRIARVLQDSSFTGMLISKWFDYRSRFLHTDSIFELIDKYIDTLSPYIKRNYEVWPIIKYKGIRGFDNIMNTGASYEEEIQIWKQWLSDRTKWIDDNINTLYSRVINPVIYAENGKDNINIVSYPNPFTDNLNIALKLSQAGELKIAIYDLTGKKYYEKSEGYINNAVHETSISFSQRFHPGIYLLKVFINNVPVATQKIIKIK